MGLAALEAGQTIIYIDEVSACAWSPTTHVVHILEVESGHAIDVFTFGNMPAGIPEAMIRANDFMLEWYSQTGSDDDLEEEQQDWSGWLEEIV